MSERKLEMVYFSSITHVKSKPRHVAVPRRPPRQVTPPAALLTLLIVATRAFIIIKINK